MHHVIIKSGILLGAGMHSRHMEIMVEIGLDINDHRLTHSFGSNNVDITLSFCITA